MQSYVEFHRLSSRNNLLETDAQQVARFVGGLRLNIQDQVSMHTIYSLTEAINLATKAEAQLERTRTVARPPIDYPQGPASKGKFPHNSTPPVSNFQRGSSSSKPHMATAGPVPPEAPRNPYSRPASDKCYRCGQPGHRSNQCPKRGVVNLIEPEEGSDREVEREGDEAEYTYEEVTGGDEGELLSHTLVVRRIPLAPRQMEHSQRHIFRIRCTVNRKV